MYSSQLKFPMPEVWTEEEVGENIRIPQMDFWGHPALPDNYGLTAFRNASSQSLVISLLHQCIVNNPMIFVLKAAFVG